MEKICLVRQGQGGWGDIFWLQHAIHDFLQEGYKVIWPVLDQFLILRDYIPTPNLHWVPMDSDFPRKDLYFASNSFVRDPNFCYLPFDTADQSFPGSVMHAKMKAIGKNWENWQENFNFVRNYEREEKLFNELGLAGQDYTFVSKKFGTYPNFVEREIPYNKNLKLVELQFLPEYNIFDYCKVLEKAKEISIIETSFNFLIEKLDLEAEKLTLVSKHVPPNWEHVGDLFKTQWEYIK